jgi:hypothetical protein
MGDKTELRSGAIHHRSTEQRATPVDILMGEIEQDYLAGRIGINADGTLTPLSDIYEDMQREQPATDYHIGPAREVDRDYHRTCQHCGTAYRTSEQTRDPDRCPYCWRLV